MGPNLPVRKLRAAHCDCTVEGFTTKLLEADTIVNLDSAYYYRIYRQTPAGRFNATPIYCGLFYSLDFHGPGLG